MAYPQNAIVHDRDPGQTMGIWAIIAAFFLPIAGIPLAIVARRKSREAGFTGNLALIALVISILYVAVFALLGLFTLATWYEWPGFSHMFV